MSSKIVFQYDNNKYYVGSTTADESPLEPGVFLIPANCTEVAPTTSPGEGQTLQWDGSEWNVVTAPKKIVANQSVDFTVDEKTTEDRLQELTAKFEQLSASLTDVLSTNEGLRKSVVSLNTTIGALNSQVESLSSAAATTSDDTAVSTTPAATSDK